MTMPNIIKETSEGTTQCRLDDIMFMRRELLCTGPVTSESMDILMQQLRYLQEQDAEKEITVFIDSPGGEVTAGMAFYDALTGSPCRIRTVCMGTAASMGAVIFLAGEDRQILPHGKIVLHDPSVYGNIGEKALQLRAISEWIMRDRENLLDIITGRCGKTREEVEKITAMDTCFDAGEALCFGIATEIIHRI